VIVEVADARARALDFLRRTRNSDGSWGYSAGAAGAVEPTLLAGAAGAGLALDWLKGAELSWGALLLPAALSGESAAAQLRSHCLATILAAEALRPKVDATVLDQDPALLGWPWVVGTVAWVEPTAYAVISLKRCGQATHPRTMQGEALLLDRQCSDGGWNYGNRHIYGQDLESDLSATGWAAMAVSAPAVGRALDRLLDARAQPSTMTLSLAVLARVSHRADLFNLPTWLVGRQSADGSFRGRSDWTALAACALGAVVDGTHVFAI
jgi:hypothetical protein